MDYADYNRALRVATGGDILPKGGDTAVAKFSADTSDLRRLLKEARENPYDNNTLHGAIADAVDELHSDNPVASLIREHFGLTGKPPRENLWYEPTENSWDGTFPYAARLGTHGPFRVYLRHEGQASDRFNPAAASNQRWVVHAVSTLPGSRDFGYTFEFPHEEAHRIPQLFPEASQHIGWADDEIPGDPATRRQAEADGFNTLMDNNERDRQ